MLREVLEALLLWSPRDGGARVGRSPMRLLASRAVTKPEPTWKELRRQLPTELRPYLLEYEWDPQLLRRLELPVDEMSIGALEWQLTLPWWRDGERYFSVRPLEVLTIPNPHREHFERAMDADLSCPLDLTPRDGRWCILDGVHRLLKAFALRESTVRVRKLPPDALPLIAVTAS
jgi:hypothetical protein